MLNGNFRASSVNNSINAVTIATIGSPSCQNHVESEVRYVIRYRYTPTAAPSASRERYIGLFV